MSFYSRFLNFAFIVTNNWIVRNKVTRADCWVFYPQPVGCQLRLARLKQASRDVGLDSQDRAMAMSPGKSHFLGTILPLPQVF